MSARAETWKPCSRYPGYEISDRGRIRSFKRSERGRIMRTRLGKDGYPRVTLQNEHGKKEVERIHLLVAEEFLGPARGRIVRHLDGTRTNPDVRNLEYGTIQENSDDKYFHGTAQVGEQNSQALLSKAEVAKIKRLYKKTKNGKRVYTQEDLGRMFQISRQAVSDLLRGKTWS